jgi:hypothetical protein
VSTKVMRADDSLEPMRSRVSRRSMEAWGWGPKPEIKAPNSWGCPPSFVLWTKRTLADQPKLSAKAGGPREPNAVSLMQSGR